MDAEGRQDQALGTVNEQYWVRPGPGSPPIERWWPGPGSPPIERWWPAPTRWPRSHASGRPRIVACTSGSSPVTMTMWRSSRVRTSIATNSWRVAPDRSRRVPVQRVHRCAKFTDLHGRPSVMFCRPGRHPLVCGQRPGLIRHAVAGPRARSGDGSQRVPCSSASAAATASPFLSLASGAAFSTETASVTASTIRAFGT